VGILIGKNTYGSASECHYFDGDHILELGWKIRCNEFVYEYGQLLNRRVGQVVRFALKMKWSGGILIQIVTMYLFVTSTMEVFSLVYMCSDGGLNVVDLALLVVI